MYGDRRLLKNQEIKTRGDQYLIERLDEYVEKSGKQRHVVLREWIEECLERDLADLLDKKNIQIKIGL